MRMIARTSIYSNLWKCRDLEIKMLWTRLTLLGVFMALTYTGYGTLLLKAFDKCPRWSLFNLLAVGASAFGCLFSLLWTTTAKGSKRWYERYEAALSRFQKVNQDLFEQDADGNRVLSYLDFSDSYLGPYLQPEDSSVMTSNGGRFSVSKIPIVMGQISLAIWLSLMTIHLLCLLVDKSTFDEILDKASIQLALVMSVGCVVVLTIICERIRSSFRG